MVEDAEVAKAKQTLRLFVLGVLIEWSEGVDEEFYIPFKVFEKRGLSRDLSRAICRELRAEGLAAYSRALWAEDGEVRGSGHGITAAGRAYYAAHGGEVWT